jgi:hypothetical protein
VASQAVVGVYGLKALRKDISQQLDDPRSELYNALKRAGYGAVKPIVPAVRSALPHGDRTTGTLANDVRASGTRTGGSVWMGRKAVPYAGWVEFGGSRRKPHYSSRQYVKDGRYLFPTARSLAAKAGDAYTAALNQVFGSGRVWTNTTSEGDQVHD